MDCIGVYPLFTKAAIKEAKEKMHPLHTKSMWVTPDNSGMCPYDIGKSFDAAATLYTATKE